MTDRVYPSAKPNPPLNGNTTTNPGFPATKAQLYGATRPAYRPQPKPQRRRRGCCCCFCLWTTLIVVALVLLVAIAGAVFWVLYRPHRPTFSVTTLRISQLNVTTPKNTNLSPQLNSKINITVSAKNPNKKVIFIYDPASITVTSSKGLDLGEGSFPGFVHGKKNTTVLKTTVSSAAKDIDSASNAVLSSDLKKKNGLGLVIELNTKVRVKVGRFKSKKVGIKVSCDGIQAIVPIKVGKAAISSSSSSSMLPSSDTKCKVNIRIKIWKWTF